MLVVSGVQKAACATAFGSPRGLRDSGDHAPGPLRAAGERHQAAGGPTHPQQLATRASRQRAAPTLRTLARRTVVNGPRTNVCSVAAIPRSPPPRWLVLWHPEPLGERWHRATRHARSVGVAAALGRPPKIVDRHRQLVRALLSSSHQVPPPCSNDVSLTPPSSDRRRSYRCRP